MLEPAPLLASDRHREHRKAVQEVGRAIERVDDPHRIPGAACATFLREEGVSGVGPMDHRDDLALGCAVDLAHEIVPALGGDLDPFDAGEAADDQFARAPRGADGDIEKGVHDVY
jgi:hypothetical protein